MSNNFLTTTNFGRNISYRRRHTTVVVGDCFVKSPLDDADLFRIVLMSARVLTFVCEVVS